MPGRLQDKVCVITGAASGIGAESARLFAAEGARVVGIDLDAEQPRASSRSQADVTDEDAGPRRLRPGRARRWAGSTC